MNTTMNAMEITEAIPQENKADSTVNAKRDQSKALGVLGRVRLRHSALLGLVLLLGWFAYSVQCSLNAIEAELDQIHANLLVK